MHEQDEQLGLILTQLGYLCDRLVVELPNPDFSAAEGRSEVSAIGRASILSHLVDDWLAGTAGGHTTREDLCPSCVKYPLDECPTCGPEGSRVRVPPDEKLTDDELRHLHYALRVHKGENDFEAKHLHELEALDDKLTRMRGLFL
jgi:hypothetical protein